MRAYLTAGAAGLRAALASGAEAVILDAPGAITAGLALTDFDPHSRHTPPLYLRLGGVEAPGFARMLDVQAPLRPAAILLPVRHGRDVAQAGAVLAVHEAEQGWEDGATRIVALVASAAGAMNLARLAGASPRLSGIGWDAAALAGELGCGSLDAAENWPPPLAQVQALVRLAAAAAGVEAIEAACPPGADVTRHAATAQRSGFGAVFAERAETVAAIRSAAASV